MKKLRILSVFLCILAIVSCDTVDFGNINKDDDAPSEPNVEGLMAGGINQFFTLAGRSYHNNPSLYVQYQTQSTYTTEARYGQNAYDWEFYFSGVLSNFKTITDITTADEVPESATLFGAPVNQTAVAEIMSAYVWKRVTDTWGPVPYSEALGGTENITPAYTDQETIYKDLISRVKAARDMIDTGLDGPTGDVIYGGDMSKWQKFANSFLLRLSMQLSKQYPSASGYAAGEFTAALNHSAGVIETVADEAWYDHVNRSGAVNPYSQNRGSDYFLSLSFTDALQGNSPGQAQANRAIEYSNSMFDARLNVFSTDPTGSGPLYGTDNGGVSGPSMTEAVAGAGADSHLMTAADTYLNRAEAADMGWTSENAANMLQQGIMMSYASIDANYDDGDSSSGMLQDDGTNYAAQRLVDATNYSMEQVINEEKWVASFPMGFQAWSNWRRTDDLSSWSTSALGFPGLYPAVDATNGGVIPRRYIYPSAEGGVNTDSYKAGVQLLSNGTDSNKARFWWDM
jgi:hypothetical protein